MPSVYVDEMQDPCSSDELTVRMDSQSNASLASPAEQEMAVWKEVVLTRYRVHGHVFNLHVQVCVQQERNCM